MVRADPRSGSYLLSSLLSHRQLPCVSLDSVVVAVVSETVPGMVSLVVRVCACAHDCD